MADPPRRTTGMSSGSIITLQRQLLDLKEKLGASQDENAELRSECNRLKMERKLLHDGEKSAISLTEEKENAWSEERVRSLKVDLCLTHSNRSLPK